MKIEIVHYALCKHFQSRTAEEASPPFWNIPKFSHCNVRGSQDPFQGSVTPAPNFDETLKPRNNGGCSESTGKFETIELDFFCKGALFRGKGGPPVLEKAARHLPRQGRGLLDHP